MTLVRLEPAALRSRVKCSTTEPLRSLKAVVNLTEDTMKVYELPENMCSKSYFTYMLECDKILRVELRVRLALPETGLSTPVKYFYWAFQGSSPFWIICIIYVLCSSCFCVISLLPCGHLKWKGSPLGSCLWCLLWFCYFPICILGQVWYMCLN